MKKLIPTLLVALAGSAWLPVAKTQTTPADKAPSTVDEAEYRVWSFKSQADAWQGGPLKPAMEWPVRNEALIVTADDNGRASASVSLLDIPADTANVVQVEMVAPSAKACRLLFATGASPNLSGEKTIEFALREGGAKELYNLDLKNVATWKEKVSMLRLDFTGAKPGEEIAVSSVKILLGDKISKPLSYATYQVAAKAVVKDFRLGSLFNSGMVLQRNARIPIWGRAKAGEGVEVEFLGRKVSTVAADGRWQVTLDPAAAGGPYEMKIHSGGETITLGDILIGDVWLCAGQSNMGDVPANSPIPEEKRQELLGTDYPGLRYVRMPTQDRSESLGNDVSEEPFKWTAAMRSSLNGFSAVSYFFGRELNASQKVPIGLIFAIKAGSQAEQWMDGRTLKTVYTPEELAQVCDRRMATGLFNGIIAPVIPFAIRGAIWYQGESNADKEALYMGYYKSLPAMIQNWRGLWKQGDFPVLLVQLPSFSGGYPPFSWAHIREAQLLASQKLPNVGMIVSFDEGDPTNLHPPNKYWVGTRLGLLARGMVYGEKVETSGPIYRSMKTKGNKVLVTFDHAGSGLVAHGPLSGFQVSGADGTKVAAQAEITGKDTLVVWSDAVANPVAVFYAWDNNPQASLFNAENLPASPFRTEAPGNDPKAQTP